MGTVYNTFVDVVNIILSNGLSMCPAFEEEEELETFTVVVRSVDSVEEKNRTGVLRLFRKMGYSIPESYDRIRKAPFLFYNCEKYDTPFLYYDPSSRDENSGGEYFKIGKDLGLKYLVISNRDSDMDSWMNTLSEDELKDVTFSLDFYIKLFNDVKEWM
jgi:hypothetical protein